MKFGKAAVMLTAGIMVTALAGCTTYNDDELDIHYSDYKQDAFVSKYSWNGSRDSMTIDIPDTFKGYEINSLGGFFSTGVPAYFTVDIDSDGNKLGFSKVIGYNEFDPDAGYEELVFTLNLGANVTGIMADENSLLRCRGDNGDIYYEVVYTVNCPKENLVFYSKEGRLYRKSDDELIDLPYPDGRVNVQEEALKDVQTAGTSESTTSAAPEQEIQEQTSESAAQTTTEEEQTVPDIDTDAVEYELAAGMWLGGVADMSTEHYWYFDGFGEGIMGEQAYDHKVPFTYSSGENELSVLYEDTDTPVTAHLTGLAEGEAVLEWEDGSIEYISYLGGFGFDWFDYYTNEELRDMESTFYENLLGEDTLVVDEEYFDADDNIVTEMHNHADEKVTFVIDRYTASGTMLISDSEIAVDLTDMYYGEPVVPEPWSPAVINRQVMLDTGKPLGVMFLGTPYLLTDYTPGDTVYNGIFHGSGADNAFGDWIYELPADRFVRTVRGREMYLIIPFDEAAEVTVTEMLYDSETYSEYPDETLYHSTDGEPFIIVCNPDDRRSDVLITIKDTKGGIYEWYPGVMTGDSGEYQALYDFDGTLYDFTDYRLVNGYYTAGDAAG